jgi:hypothetical protein
MCNCITLKQLKLLERLEQFGDVDHLLWRLDNFEAYDDDRLILIKGGHK